MKRLVSMGLARGVPVVNERGFWYTECYLVDFKKAKDFLKKNPHWVLMSRQMDEAREDIVQMEMAKTYEDDLDF